MNTMKLLIRQAPHRTFLAAWGYSFEPILSRTNAPPELTTAFRRVVNSSPTCGAKPFKHLLSSACGRNDSGVFTRTITSMCRSLPSNDSFHGDEHSGSRHGEEPITSSYNSVEERCYNEIRGMEAHHKDRPHAHSRCRRRSPAARSGRAIPRRSVTVLIEWKMLLKVYTN